MLYYDLAKLEFGRILWLKRITPNWLMNQKKLNYQPKWGKKLAPDRSLFRILMAIFTFISSGQEVQLKQFHLYLVVPWDFQVFQHPITHSD
ncbi:hypothetical protein DSECCO2_403650 [anaerobic digester metagenome]